MKGWNLAAGFVLLASLSFTLGFGVAVFGPLWSDLMNAQTRAPVEVGLPTGLGLVGLNALVAVVVGLVIWWVAGWDEP